MPPIDRRFSKASSIKIITLKERNPSPLLYTENIFLLTYLPERAVPFFWRQMTLHWYSIQRIPLYRSSLKRRPLQMYGTIHRCFDKRRPLPRPFDKIGLFLVFVDKWRPFMVFQTKQTFF